MTYITHNGAQVYVPGAAPDDARDAVTRATAEIVRDHPELAPHRALVARLAQAAQDGEGLFVNDGDVRQEIAWRAVRAIQREDPTHA